MQKECANKKYAKHWKTNMNNWEWWKNIMIGGLCLMIMIVYADFIRNPEKYGEIMNRYETARYLNSEEIE